MLKHRQLFAKVIKNYECINKNHAKMTKKSKNGRKIRENHFFLPFLFDYYKKYRNFAKKFLGNADKITKSLIFNLKLL